MKVVEAPELKGAHYQMKRRKFTPEEKAKIVLEAIRGEKELSQIATEHELAVNQVRNWKNEAIEKLSIVFDGKRDDNLKSKITEQDQELEQAYKKIGQLTTKVDWLEKKSEELYGPGWENRYTTRPK